MIKIQEFKQIKAWAIISRRKKIPDNGGILLIFTTKTLAEHHCALMPNSYANDKIIKVEIKGQ